MLPSKGSRQCSSSQPLYTSISPTSSKTLVPLGALGLCMFLYSSMTLSAPVPSINIGQGSPPRFNVVDISQEGQSLCLFNSSPFLYILEYEYVGINCSPVSLAITGSILTNRVSITGSA